jgi:hypothetical protein
VWTVNRLRQAYKRDEIRLTWFLRGWVALWVCIVLVVGVIAFSQIR